MRCESEGMRCVSEGMRCGSEGMGCESEGMMCVSEGMCRANLKVESHDHLVRIRISPRFLQKFRCFSGYIATFISEGSGSHSHSHSLMKWLYSRRNI